MQALEAFGCLFSLALTIATLVGVVWLIRRALRVSELELRLDSLQAEVGELRQRIQGTPVSMEGAGSAPPEEAAETAVPPTSAATPLVPHEDALSDAGSSAASSAGSSADPAREAGTASSDDSAAAEERDAGETGAPAFPPPPATPSPDVDQPPSTPPKKSIDWEQWIGVRGAALVGGVALALAGIYLVRLGMERGLLSPLVRVSLGLLAGVASLAAGQFLRARRYELLANALSGAGLVFLYSATWAARNLYDLIGDGVATLLFVLTTVCGGVLSVRYRSKLIAALGLIGGFATPLLTGSQEDQPVRLFAYLVALNVGVLLVARRTRWSALPVLGIALTLFYQLLWIFTSLDGRFVFGLLLMAGLSALFLLAGALPSRLTGIDRTDESPLRRVVDGIALLSIAFFAFYFAWSADVARIFWPLFVVLLLLSVSGVVLARAHAMWPLGFASVFASLGVLAAWLIRRATAFDTSSRWNDTSSLQVAGALLALGVAHWGLFELRRRRAIRSLSAAEEAESHDVLENSATAETPAGPLRRDAIETHFEALTTLCMQGGLFALLALSLALSQGPVFLATLTAGLLLAAILLRVSSEIPQAIPAATVGLAILFATRMAGGEHDVTLLLDVTTPVVGALALLVGVLLAGRCVALSRTDLASAHQYNVAAVALFSIGVTLALAAARDLDANLALFLATGTTLAGVVAVSIRGWGTLFCLLVAASTITHWAHFESSETPALTLAILWLSAALWACWPLLLQVTRFERSRSAFRLASIAPWLWLPPMIEIWQRQLQWPAVAALPLSLAALHLLLLQRTGTFSGPRRTARLAWLAVSGLSLVAVAIPLQLEREWITVAWALQCLATAAVWRRLDHPGLKVFALLLALATFVRLVFNPAVFDYYPARSPLGWPVLNWLLYGYLVPAAALLLARSRLADLEVARLREPEKPLYDALPGPRIALVANTLGVSALVIVFAWLNLTILDAFAANRELRLPVDRVPLRDLMLSISWVVFALSLLVLGVLRRGRSLRWASLVVMLAALAKVFFSDLGELTGMFRVLSLLGVALALIAISLLYQRFVFRPEPENPSDSRAIREPP